MVHLVGSSQSGTEEHGFNLTPEALDRSCGALLGPSQAQSAAMASPRKGMHTDWEGRISGLPHPEGDFIIQPRVAIGYPR
jgi:hypothetical protein